MNVITKVIAGTALAALTVAGCGTAKSTSRPAGAPRATAAAAATAAPAAASPCAGMQAWLAGAAGYTAVGADLGEISAAVHGGVSEGGLAAVVADSRALAADAHTAVGDPPPVGAAPFLQAMVSFEAAGYLAGYRGDLAAADTQIAQGGTQVKATTAAIAAECG